MSGGRCEEEEEEEEEEEGLFKADAVREYRYGSMQERERREVTSAPGRIVPGANGKRSAKLPSVIVKSQLRNPRQTNLNPQSSRLSLAYTIAYRPCARGPTDPVGRVTYIHIYIYIYIYIYFPVCVAAYFFLPKLTRVNCVNLRA